MTLNSSAIKAAAGVVTALLLGTMAIATLSGARNETTHLSLVQSKPDLHTDAANPGKPRDGDDVTFYANVSEDGKPVGHVAGVKVEVRNPTDPGASDLSAKHDIMRITLMTFSFGGNDSLMAQGLTLDKTDGMVAKLPEVRAITGGTGKYEFASGQVTTTREPDGTYHHEIELRTL
jgi:hypothetical protein